MKSVVVNSVIHAEEVNGKCVLNSSRHTAHTLFPQLLIQYLHVHHSKGIPICDNSVCQYNIPFRRIGHIVLLLGMLDRLIYLSACELMHVTMNCKYSHTNK